MLKQANMIFKEIHSKYPLFMYPLRIGQLNSEGFRWLQHDTENIIERKKPKRLTIRKRQRRKVRVENVLLEMKSHGES